MQRSVTSSSPEAPWVVNVKRKKKTRVNKDGVVVEPSTAAGRKPLRTKGGGNSRSSREELSSPKRGSKKLSSSLSTPSKSPKRNSFNEGSNDKQEQTAPSSPLRKPLQKVSSALKKVTAPLSPSKKKVLEEPKLTSLLPVSPTSSSTKQSSRGPAPALRSKTKFKS